MLTLGFTYCPLTVFAGWIRKRTSRARLWESVGRTRSLAQDARLAVCGTSGVTRRTPYGARPTNLSPNLPVPSLTNDYSRNCKKGNRLCSYNCTYICILFMAFTLLLIVPKLESPSYNGLAIYPHLDVSSFPPVEIRLLRHAMDHEAESGLLSHNDIYSLWVRKLPRSRFFPLG